jgi:hypothetical protein
MPATSMATIGADLSVIAPVLANAEKARLSVIAKQMEFRPSIKYVKRRVASYSTK